MASRKTNLVTRAAMSSVGPRIGRRSRPDTRPHRASVVLAESLVASLLIALAGGAVVVPRLQPPRTVSVPVGAVGGGAPAGTPTELKAGAASLLEQATTRGGTGYRFEIVQRTTLHARPGGPKIEGPGADGKPAEVDSAYLLGLVETGYVTPDGFLLEIRSGPGSPIDAPDPKAGELRRRALVRDGVTYRDDGDGWYRTDQPPGIGLDPATAALLPTLLRDAGQPEEADLAAMEGELGRRDDDAVRAITATGTVEDLPGVISVDGESFTELTAPVTFTFDAAGRLTGLVAAARNTGFETFDLRVTTEITLHYDDVPIALPDATPLWAGADDLNTVP
jgi:hypothetical protein